MTRLLLVLGILLVAGGLGLLGFAGLSGESSTLVVGDGRPSPGASLPGEATSTTERAGSGLSTSTSRLTTSTAPAASTTSTAPPASTTSTAPAAPSTAAPAPRILVAWQPSHQDDTGGPGWHEYLICEDIARQTITLLEGSGVRSVLAWETGMGLTGSNNTGSNAPAFDSEIRQANEAGADYFISIHNDGGAPSGVLGMFFTGDTRSQAHAERFARTVSDLAGLPYRGIRGHNLYSLDQARNQAPIRILLEIGDNQKDRAFLENPDNRRRIAEALAQATRDLPKP